MQRQHEQRAFLVGAVELVLVELIEQLGDGMRPFWPRYGVSVSVQSIASSTRPVFLPRDTISYGSSSACRLLS